MSSCLGRRLAPLHCIILVREDVCPLTTRVWRRVPRLLVASIVIARLLVASIVIGVIVAAFSYGGERPGNISVELARSWLLTRQTSRKCGSDYPSTVAAAMTAQVNGGTSIAHHVSIMHMMLLVQFLFSPIDPGLTLGGVI